MIPKITMPTLKVKKGESKPGFISCSIAKMTKDQRN